MSHSPEKPLLAVLTGERGWREIVRPLQAIGHPIEVLDWDALRKSARYPHLRFIAELWTRLHRCEFEHVFTDMSSVFLAAILLLGKWRGATVLMRLRGDLFAESRDQIRFHFAQRQPLALARSLLTYGLDQLCFPWIDRYVPVSDWIVRRLHIQHKSSIVRIPCNPADFPVRTHTATPIRVLAVTNFNYPQKVSAMGRFFDASCASLHAHGITFSVAGTGIALDGFRARYGSEVEFFGRIDGIEPLYAQYDVFIHFSGLDAFPYVVLEAQAAGLPVVVNNDCGMLEQVENGRTGFIVNLDQTAEVEHCLLSLRDSPELRRETGRRAREMVSQTYSMKSIGTDLRQVLKPNATRHQNPW